jgi:hypothetical protein
MLLMAQGLFAGNIKSERVVMLIETKSTNYKCLHVRLALSSPGLGLRVESSGFPWPEAAFLVFFSASFYYFP